MRRKIEFWIVFTIDESIYVTVEFDGDEQEDIMIPAVNALRNYMKENHKGREYDVGYWWWVE